MSLIRVYTFLLSLPLFLSFPAVAQSDVDQIKAVIAEETASYYNVDHKKWFETWAKVPYASWSYADRDTYRLLDGWETMNKAFEEYFKTGKPSHSEIINEWIEVRIYDGGAYVRFNQKVKDDFEIQLTSQVRVLEFQDGRWKIVRVQAISRD